ncbi:MAG: GNAT family N-acetyltransferase [Gemmatimonadaceae bacterium]
MRNPVLVRPARAADVDGIAALVNGFAAEASMLARTPEAIAMDIESFVVAVTQHGRLTACGALREYSPSLAEVASVAVARHAHGMGLGRAIVSAVEDLARVRGIDEVFALTLTPRFFEALGYEPVDRSLYPEKIGRDCVGCARRLGCREICVRRRLERASLSIAA